MLVALACRSVASFELPFAETRVLAQLLGNINKLISRVVCDRQSNDIPPLEYLGKFSDTFVGEIKASVASASYLCR